MSEQQWKRLEGVERIDAGRLTVGEAAEVLGLSMRQVRRLRRAVERRGVKEVAHGNAGRKPKARISEAVRQEVVELGRNKYEGFNDQHSSEKLAKIEKVKISRASIQRILRAAGIGAARRRRPPKHRRRRDRRAQAGQMILWDGSRHALLEDRGPMLCLIAAIDGATGELLPGGHFVEQECAAGYLGVIKTIAKERGLPLSAYMDRHGSLKRNDAHWTLEEELRGKQDPTQIGRALQVEMIYALSPQAKGESRTAVGDATGPPGLRASVREGHGTRAGQRGSGEVPA